MRTFDDGAEDECVVVVVGESLPFLRRYFVVVSGGHCHVLAKKQVRLSDNSSCFCCWMGYLLAVGYMQHWDSSWHYKDAMKDRAMVVELMRLLNAPRDYCLW